MWNWLRRGGCWIAILLLSMLCYTALVHRLWRDGTPVSIGGYIVVPRRRYKSDGRSPPSRHFGPAVVGTSLKWGCCRESCDWPRRSVSKPKTTFRTLIWASLVYVAWVFRKAFCNYYLHTYFFRSTVEPPQMYVHSVLHEKIGLVFFRRSLPRSISFGHY